MHLASYGVRYGDNNIDTMIEVNVKLSAKIMDFCIKNGCKTFLYVGSCFQYGSQNCDFIDENTFLNPEDLYAASKTACEVFLKTLAVKNNIQFITCRPFGVYGKYEPETRLLPLIYNHGINNQPLDMSSGEQIRDYLYVRDVANGFYQIIINSNNFEMVDSVNICSAKPCSVREFAESVIKLKSFDSSLFHFGVLPYRKNESMRFVGNNSKLKELTGWEQKYDLKDGILDFCEYINTGD